MGTMYKAKTHRAGIGFKSAPWSHIAIHGVPARVEVVERAPPTGVVGNRQP